MAESGGPIYEGSARPEQVKPRLIDKLKAKWQYALEASKKNSPAYKDAREEWKKIGPSMEKAQLEAAEKVMNILGEGKLRQAAEKLRPVIKTSAKVNRVATAVPDVVVTSLGIVGGVNQAWEGLKSVFGKSETGRGRDIFYGSGIAALMVGLHWLAPTRRLVTKYYEVMGSLADRVAAKTNKILRGNPKAPAAA